MWRRAALLCAATIGARADWSVPPPPGLGRGAPSTKSKHAELGLDEMFRREVVAGVGCWWEGDNWEHVVECCGCEKCDRTWYAKCCSWNVRWAARCCPCNREYAMQP
mmetsp:Transcript_24634/g.75971  ORF Transcript_24634/g.75971 Transcript_24634/m.75971 type:complete len:107 (+) Transcript_24634:711-1031(+)